MNIVIILAVLIIVALLLYLGIKSYKVQCQIHDEIIILKVRVNGASKLTLEELYDINREIGIFMDKYEGNLKLWQVMEINGLIQYCRGRMEQFK